MAKRKQAKAKADRPDSEDSANIARSAGNLAAMDLAMRAGSTILRNVVEKRISGPDSNEPKAKAKKSFAGNLARVAAARIASKSVPGAIVVGSGIAAKFWYDHAKRRRDERHGKVPKL